MGISNDVVKLAAGAIIICTGVYILPIPVCQVIFGGLCIIGGALTCISGIKERSSVENDQDGDDN